MPDQIQFIQGHKNLYTYDAAGKKLEAINYTVRDIVNVPIGTISTLPASSSDYTKLTTDYVGNLIYENGSLKEILLPDGYWQNGVYYYYLKDHLGNNRVVINNSGAVVEKSHYYPSGMRFYPESTSNSAALPYRYNGKEMEAMNGLNQMDYGARRRYSGLPIWTGPDELREKYYSISPYAYCAGNPVNAVDPDGREVRIKGDEKYRKETFNNLQQLSSSKLALLKNGKVVEASSYKGKSSQISLTGSVTGNGKDKVNGTALVHDVISDKHTATIQAGKENEFNPTSQTNASTAKVGSGGTLSFNNEPTGVVRGIVNQDGSDHVSDQSVLGHELLHARHSFQGTVNYKTVDVQDPDRNNWAFPMSREELRTRSFENYIRSEQGDEPRAQPTINNQ